MSLRAVSGGAGKVRHLRKGGDALAYVTPTYSIDFTTGSLVPTIGSGTPTFARASTGTYVNSSGLITSAAIDTPRFEYDPVTLAALGLLMEDQRTNLCLRSAEIDNASWNKGADISVTGANAWVSPDGGTNADVLTITGIGNGLYQTIAVDDSPAVYEFSFYVKLGTLAAADYKIAVYNATAGSFIAVDVVPTQTPTSTGWTRIKYLISSPVGCASIRIYPFRNSSVTSGTFSVWGVQLEQNTSIKATGPSSYIPTTTVSVTRNRDQCYLALASMGGFDATKGTMYTKVDSYELDYNPIQGWAAAASLFNNNPVYNYIALMFANITDSGIEMVMDDWTGNVYSLEAHLTDADTTRSICGSYEVSGGVVVPKANVNGKTLSAGGDPYPTLPTVSHIAFGHMNLTDDWHILGHIRRFDYWNTVLSSRLMQNLTY